MVFNDYRSWMLSRVEKQCGFCEVLRVRQDLNLDPSCQVRMNQEQTNALNRRDAEIAEFSKSFLRVLCDSAVIL